MKVRRRARIVALQALFEVDSVRHDPDAVLRQRIEESSLPPSGQKFAHSLLYGVLKYKTALDEIIQRNAPEWPVEQMAIIDRNILRIAMFEIGFDDGSTPVKVAINEAVELAKTFGSESSRRFVNGVLGTYVAELEGITWQEG